MLHDITWQQYSTAVILITAVWYGYVLLKFYKPRPKTLAATPPVANQMMVVMSAIKPDTDTGVHEADELHFSVASPDDISDQTLPKGPGDELLEEAQTLIAAYTENDDKKSFLSLLKILLNKYEVFADEISLPTVIDLLKQFAKARLPFTLKDNEWPLTFEA
ncbi:hypothetical protein ACFGVR_15570 [Mucilaginibacter sp. AW1-3]